MTFPSVDPRHILILNLTERVDQRYRHSLYKEEAKRYLGFCIEKILKKRSGSEPIEQYVDHYLDRIAYSINKHSLIAQTEKELFQLNVLKQTAQFDTFSFQKQPLVDQEEKEEEGPLIREEIKTINTESCRLLSRSTQAKKEKDKEIQALKNSLLSINAEQKEWEKKVEQELIRTKEWEKKCEEEQNATVKKIYALNQSIDACIERIKTEPDRLKKEDDSLKRSWEKQVEQSCNRFATEHAALLKEQKERITSLLNAYTMKRDRAIKECEKKKSETIHRYRSMKNESQLDYEQRCEEIRSEYDDLIIKPTESLPRNPRIDLTDPNITTIDQQLKKRQALSLQMKQLELNEKIRAENQAEQTHKHHQQEKNKQVNLLEKEERRYFKPTIQNIGDVLIKKILKELGRS